MVIWVAPPTISWNSNNDRDLYGYKLYRSDNFGPYNLLTSLDKNTTSFIDNDLIISNGKFDPVYCYKVSAIDIGGLESDKSNYDCIKSSTINKSVADNPELNNTSYEYKLFPVYPNPFNPSTLVTYSLPRASMIEIKLFDQLGKEIALLFYGNKSKGIYSFTIDFSKFNGGLSSGVYILRMSTDGFVESQKINYIK